MKFLIGSTVIMLNSTLLRQFVNFGTVVPLGPNWSKNQKFFDLLKIWYWEQINNVGIQYFLLHFLSPYPHKVIIERRSICKHR